MKLETERLWLRPITLNDKEEIFQYRSDAETNKYQGWIPKTSEDVVLFIDKISKQLNEPHTWFQFVLVEKRKQGIIGDIGIHFFDNQNKQVEIGCTIGKAYQKQGYAAESLRNVIDFLFNELDKHRIIASIDPDNRGSIRLYEQLGFRKEAHFVEGCFIDGLWKDDLIYALIEKDWIKLAGA